MKLNQVIAIIQTTKNNAAKSKTAIYHAVQKSNLFQGISRTFNPIDEDGFIYPSENQEIQEKVEDLLIKFAESNYELFDLCCTQDIANTKAKSNLKIGNNVLSDLPVSYLLFLEKQMIDVKTFISSLPILDNSESWNYNTQYDCYTTDPKLTTKTKKIVKPVVLYEATKEHPAQVKESSEDIPEGIWKAIKLSGAISQARQNQLLQKINNIIEAIIFAREEANSLAVEKVNVGKIIFDYLFSK